MQNLPKAEYFDFLKKILDAYRKGHVNGKLLVVAFLADPSWNSILVENYKDPVARELLSELRNLDGVGEDIGDWIDNVLSGKSLLILKKSIIHGALGGTIREMVFGITDQERRAHSICKCGGPEEQPKGNRPSNATKPTEPIPINSSTVNPATQQISERKK